MEVSGLLGANILFYKPLFISFSEKYLCWNTKIDLTNSQNYQTKKMVKNIQILENLPGTLTDFFIGRKLHAEFILDTGNPGSINVYHLRREQLRAFGDEVYISNSTINFEKEYGRTIAKSNYLFGSEFKNGTFTCNRLISFYNAVGVEVLSNYDIFFDIRNPEKNSIYLWKNFNGETVDLTNKASSVYQNEMNVKLE